MRVFLIVFTLCVLYMATSVRFSPVDAATREVRQEKILESRNLRINPDRLRTGYAGSFEAQWRVCSKDSDCKVVGEECSYEAVNDDFENEAEDKIKAAYKGGECDNAVIETPEAVCYRDMCVLDY